MAAFPGTSHQKRHLLAFSFLSLISFALVRNASAQSSECSLSKTNKSCTLTIDRSNPVAPSTVQMYSDQQLTVIVKNPLPFERYFLDFSTGQATVTPDVAANIVTSLSGNLGKMSDLFHSNIYDDTVKKTRANPKAANAHDACDVTKFKEQPWDATGHVEKARPDFDTCFGVLAGDAITIYRDLEPLVAPDALTSGALTSRTLDYLTTQSDIQSSIDKYRDAETEISNELANLAKSAAATGAKYTSEEQTYIAELGVYQKIIDAVNADLTGYEQRIKDIGPCGYDDSNPTPSPKPFCWEKTTQTYSLGDLALWMGKFYTRTDRKTCTHGGGPALCAAPDQDSNVWKQVAPVDIKFTGNFDPSASYQTGNEANYKGNLWTCISACVASRQPTSPAWIEGVIAQGQAPPVTIKSRQDDNQIYQGMVTRAITYSLDTLNLVSYSQQAAATATNKKALATVAINFADEPTRKFPGYPPTALRLEASAGVFFSWLPSRTFTTAQPPNACSVSTGTPTVYDCTTRPTPVPFAAANYRLTGDMRGRWKQNFYMTAAVGVNPNNTTAEFGVGPSYAWRAFMVSTFCHFGHDVKWSSTTPNSNGDLPTYNHWTVKAAVGISVRVPSLTAAFTVQWL